MKAKIELDHYEYGIIIRSLKDLREKQIENDRPTEPVDDILLKLIKVYEKFKLDKQKAYDVRW